MAGVKRPFKLRAIRAAALLAALIGALSAFPQQAAAQDLTLTKTANPTTYTAAGQVITYTYVITNLRGDGHLLRPTDGFPAPFGLTDDKATISTCPPGTPLPLNTPVTCTGTYTITAPDLTAGSVTNNATARADACNDGCLATATAQATVTFSPQPSWTLTKTPSPTTYTVAGQVITYSYVLTNTGNATINSISISDSKVATVSCPVTTLAAGANTNCLGFYTITAADVSAGSVTNTATANGTPTGGSLLPVTATATVTFVPQPAWTLTKIPSPTTYSAVNQIIVYNYSLTNTGNVTINSIALTDNKVAPVSCPATTLAPGVNMLCTGFYTTTAADISAASIVNTATANGTPTSGTLQPVTATATVTFVAQPVLGLTKLPNPPTYSAAGQVITYSYVVTNLGNVTINSLTVTDNKVAPISCPVTTLAPAANTTCTGTYTTTAADVSAGSVVNIGTANGTPTSGTLAPAIAQATITFAAQPAWTLSKTPSPTTYTAAGQVINYSYVVTNTGNVTINSIAVTDNKIATVSCSTTTLAAGANTTCTGSYTTTAADVIAGSVVNTGTANGTPASGTLAPATAQATITFVAQPAWTLTKTANPTIYSAAGQVITYTYVVANSGNVTINSIAVTDNKVAPVSCPATTLAAGANMTCSGSYATTAADTSAGSVVNTGTANGTPTGGTLAPATAQATITFRPPPTGSITIVKSATGGDNTFNFSSTIAAATSFSLVTIGGTASRTFANLGPGTYTFSEINLPLNWKLSTLSCTGDAGGAVTTVSVSGRSASIGLDGGESITCTFGNVFDIEAQRRQTQEVIYRFLSHRIELLANNDPDRSRLIRRLPGSLWGDEDTFGSFTPGGGGGPFSFSGNSSAFSSMMSFSTSMSRIAAAHEEAAAKSDLETLTAYAMPVKAAAKPLKPVSALDVWVEAHFSQFKADDRGIGNNGNFGITYLGADYLVTSSVLVGALVQFDWMTEKSKTLLSNVQGNGVMAGPYASVRLTPNLFFDARAAWGTSDNKVDPFGLYQDKFTTSRWLAHANLTGNWQFGNYRVTPSAGLTYVEETQRSYTDTLGVLIPEQTVALGRFSVGPEIAYRYLAPSGVTYEPHVSVKGVWDFKRPDATSVDGLIVTGNTLSASVETGLLARAPSGWSFRGAVSYDGLGGNNLHAVTGKLWLNIPFH